MAFTEPYVKAGQDKVRPYEELEQQAIAIISQRPGIDIRRLAVSLGFRGNKPRKKNPGYISADAKAFFKQFIASGNCQFEKADGNVWGMDRFYPADYKPVEPKNYGRQYGQLKTYVDPELAGSWEFRPMQNGSPWDAAQTRIRAERMKAIAGWKV